MSTPASSRATHARQLLMQAPPGELREVLNDVRAIFQDDAAIVPLLADALPSYNEEHCIEVAAPAAPNDKLLVCRSALVAPPLSPRGCSPGATAPQLLDPRSGKLHTIDHAALVLSASADNDLYKERSNDHPLLAELQRGVDAYVAEHLPQATGLVYGVKDSDSYEINIVNTKINSDNYWNARWRSQWTWSPSRATLSGCVSALVHFFEEGNVQLNMRRNYDSNPASGGPRTADAALKALRDSEESFRASLELSFTALNENVYKRLRRALPITKTKMDWHKVSSYRLGNDLSNNRHM